MKWSVIFVKRSDIFYEILCKSNNYIFKKKLRVFIIRNLSHDLKDK